MAGHFKIDLAADVSDVGNGAERPLLCVTVSAVGFPARVPKKSARVRYVLLTRG
jgi:hypothetical protein